MDFQTKASLSMQLMDFINPAKAVAESLVASSVRIHYVLALKR